MLKLLIVIAGSIALHELGHFIIAKIFKVKILSVQLFMMPIFFIFFKGILFKIGIIPVIGYTNAPKIKELSDIKKIIYFAAGICVNCLLLLIHDRIIIGVNLYFIIFNLIPFRNSDGKQIFVSLQNCVPLLKPKN